jgi:hypothetical protein
MQIQQLLKDLGGEFLEVIFISYLCVHFPGSTKTKPDERTLPGRSYPKYCEIIFFFMLNFSEGILLLA